MRRTGLARGQGMKLAVSSAPKARKVFVSHPRAGRRALLGIQAAHLLCAKWSFWWVIFREQTWVTSRERRSAVLRLSLFTAFCWQALLELFDVLRGDRTWCDAIEQNAINLRKAFDKMAFGKLNARD